MDYTEDEYFKFLETFDASDAYKDEYNDIADRDEDEYYDDIYKELNEIGY